LRELKVSEASLAERLQSLTRELEYTRNAITDRERRIQELAQSIEQLEKQLAELKNGDGAIEARVAELHQLIGREQDEMNLVRDKLSLSNAEIDSAVEKARGARSAVDAKSSEAQQLALDAERLNGDLAHLIQNLQEKYGPDCFEVAASAEQTEMENPV